MERQNCLALSLAASLGLHRGWGAWFGWIDSRYWLSFSNQYLFCSFQTSLFLPSLCQRRIRSRCIVYTLILLVYLWITSGASGSVLALLHCVTAWNKLLCKLLFLCLALFYCTALILDKQALTRVHDVLWWVSLCAHLLFLERFRACANIWVQYVSACMTMYATENMLIPVSLVFVRGRIRDAASRCLPL